MVIFRYIIIRITEKVSSANFPSHDKKREHRRLKREDKTEP